MPLPLLLAFVVFVLVNLLVSAQLLWVACRVLPHPRVQAGLDWLESRLRRRPGGLARPLAHLGFLRGLVLTLVIAAVGWLLLAGVVGVVHAATGASIPLLVQVALPPLGILVPLVVIRHGVGLDWLQTGFVWALWRLTSLGQTGVAWLVFRAFFAASFAELLPRGWLPWE